MTLRSLDATSLRDKIRFYLNDVETPLGRALNLGLTGVVLLSSAIFVAQTYPIPAAFQVWLDRLDQLILIVFVLEYLVRFWCAETKWRYCFSLYSMIDLLAILPFVIGAGDIRFIRVFRWFRILRLIRFMEGKTMLGYFTSEDSAIFTRILLTLFIIVFVFSGLIYQVEHSRNPDRFTTFLDAVYFAVATMTTVGFGDVTPVTQTGRLLTILMIWTGIALIPWQFGDLIKRLIKTANQAKQQTICPTCGLASHDDDARFCRACGTSLEQAIAQKTPVNRA